MIYENKELTIYLGEGRGIQIGGLKLMVKSIKEADGEEAKVGFGVSTPGFHSFEVVYSEGSVIYLERNNGHRDYVQAVVERIERIQGKLCVGLSLSDLNDLEILS